MLSTGGDISSTVSRTTLRACVAYSKSIAVIRRRYFPSGATAPKLSRPSQTARIACPLPAYSLITAAPASATKTFQSAGRVSSAVTVTTSARPSPFGEKASAEMWLRIIPGRVTKSSIGQDNRMAAATNAAGSIISALMNHASMTPAAGTYEQANASIACSN